MTDVNMMSESNVQVSSDAVAAAAAAAASSTDASELEQPQQSQQQQQLLPPVEASPPINLLSHTHADAPTSLAAAACASAPAVPTRSRRQSTIDSTRALQSQAAWYAEHPYEARPHKRRKKQQNTERTEKREEQKQQREEQQQQHQQQPDEVTLSAPPPPPARASSDPTSFSSAPLLRSPSPLSSSDEDAAPADDSDEEEWAPTARIKPDRRGSASSTSSSGNGDDSLMRAYKRKQADASAQVQARQSRKRVTPPTSQQAADMFATEPLPLEQGAPQPVVAQLVAPTQESAHVSHIGSHSRGRGGRKRARGGRGGGGGRGSRHGAGTGRGFGSAAASSAEQPAQPSFKQSGMVSLTSSGSQMQQLPPLFAPTIQAAPYEPLTEALANGQHSPFTFPTPSSHTSVLTQPMSQPLPTDFTMSPMFSGELGQARSPTSLGPPFQFLPPVTVPLTASSAHLTPPQQTPSFFPALSSSLPAGFSPTSLSCFDLSFTPPPSLYPSAFSPPLDPNLALARPGSTPLSLPSSPLTLQLPHAPHSPLSLSLPSGYVASSMAALRSAGYATGSLMHSPATQPQLRSIAHSAGNFTGSTSGSNFAPAVSSGRGTATAAATPSPQLHMCSSSAGHYQSTQSAPVSGVQYQFPPPPPISTSPLSELPYSSAAAAAAACGPHEAADPSHRDDVLYAPSITPAQALTMHPRAIEAAFSVTSAALLAPRHSGNLWHSDTYKEYVRKQIERERRQTTEGSNSR